MSKQTSPRPFSEIFDEFVSKVEYLKLKYNYEHGFISQKIKIDGANLTSYLNKSKSPRLSTLMRLLNKLNAQFAQEFVEFKAGVKPYIPDHQGPPYQQLPAAVVEQIKADLSLIRTKVDAQEVFLEALGAVLLKYLAGKIQGKSIMDLYKELEQKKAEITRTKRHSD